MLEKLIKFKDLTVESLKENKKLIIGLYIVFIILFIVSWIYAGSRIDTVISNINAAGANTTTIGADVSATELLISNEVGGIFTYFGSVFFAIPAIVMLFYNGYQMGAFGSLFEAYMPNGGLTYIIYLIPHGIFEITATVIESVAGILLFIFIWKFIRTWLTSKNRTEAFNQTKKILIQSVILFIFSAILLVIAAPIEAYFSVPFSNFIVGLL